METEKEAPKITSMVDRFFETLDEIDAAEAVVKKLKSSRDAQQLAIIDTLEEQGMTQVKDAQDRTVFLKAPRIYASVNKENEKEAVELLKRSWKLGYLFKEQVSSSALGRIVSERLSKGLEVPEKFVTYYAKKEIGYRSGKATTETE